MKLNGVKFYQGTLAVDDELNYYATLENTSGIQVMIKFIAGGGILPVQFDKSLTKEGFKVISKFSMPVVDSADFEDSHGLLSPLDQSIRCLNISSDNLYTADIKRLTKMLQENFYNICYLEKDINTFSIYSTADLKTVKSLGEFIYDSTMCFEWTKIAHKFSNGAEELYIVYNDIIGTIMKSVSKNLKELEISIYEVNIDIPNCSLSFEKDLNP